jgi:hypothetical protein
MILGGLLLGYCALLCGGFGITVLLMRGASRLNIVECCCLAWLFGIGVVSLLLWILGMFCSGLVLPSLVAAFCLALGAMGWIKTSRSQAKFFIPRPQNLFQWILLGFLAFEIAIVFWVSLKNHLGWDGLLMWEAKARFAFLSNNVLPAHYYTSGRSLTHPEYPLAIPFTELWLYLWMGEAHQLWIKTVFATFYAFGVVQLAIITARFTGKRWFGYMAAVLFFFVPHEIVRVGSATRGYVDFPLSIVYLVVIGYLLLSLRSESKYDFRIYAASLLLLPWFKREGAILWVIAVLAGVTIILTQKKPRVWLAALCPGALIIFGWSWYLRAMHLEVPPEFVSVTLSAFLQNAGRLIPTWRILFLEVSDPENWGLFWLLATLALAYLLVRIRKLEPAILAWAAVVPVLAYSSIYVFSTSVDYFAHIKLSLPRLLMHVVPVFWLAIASAWAKPFSIKTLSHPKLADSPAR